MGLVMTLLWLVAFYVVGLGVAVAAGPLGASVVGVDSRSRIADAYFKIGAMGMGRIGLVRRSVSGYALVSTDWDSRFEADKFTLDGETSHVTDPGERGFAGRFYGKPFEVVPEDVATIVSPTVAAAGKRYHDMVQDTEDRASGGFEKFVDLPQRAQLVDPMDAIHIVPHSSGLQTPERVAEYIKKAQAGYNSTDIKTVFTLLVAYCIGAGVVFVLLNYGGNLPSTPTSSEQLGGVLLGVVG